MARTVWLSLLFAPLLVIGAQAQTLERAPIGVIHKKKPAPQVKFLPGMRHMTIIHAKEPDALGKGAAIGAPSATLAGAPGCHTSSAFKTVMDVVSFVVSAFGGNVSYSSHCGLEKRDIATGVTLGPPPAKTEPHPRWGYMGGQGALMADAAVCLIKDIGNHPGGRIDLHTPTTSGIVHASTEQIVGLESFDPVARKAVFYHVVRACAPMLGCMDATRQTITAQVRSSAPLAGTAATSKAGGRCA